MRSLCVCERVGCVGIGDCCFLCCWVCVHVMGSLCVWEGCVSVGTCDFVFCVVGWCVWDFVIFVFCVVVCVYT